MQTALIKIDSEPCQFSLYETPDKKWIVDFSYSPQSSIDLSMLIALSESEKAAILKNRCLLIDLSKNVRNNYQSYLKKALHRDEFIFEKN